MENIKILTKHEFLRQIQSFKFTLLLLISIIITVACVFVQIKDFEDRQNTYFSEVQKAEKLKGTFRVYSNFRIPLIIPPNPLSIFAKGYDDKIGNKVTISIADVPEFESTSQKKNPFLEIFLNFDVSSIVLIILSLMTIFLMSDTISGEREELTLKLIFVNHVKRFDFFLSKFIAGLIILSIPLLIIFLTASLMVIFNPMISMSSEMWFKVVILFAACVLFIATYILLGLIISTKTSSSSNSVIYGLLLWIILVLVYPNTINYVVNNSVKIPSIDEIETQINEIRGETQAEMYKNLEIPQRGGVNYSYANTWIVLPYIMITQKYVFEAWEKAVEKNIPIWFDLQRRISNIRNEYSSKLIRQNKIAGYFLKIIPGFMLEESLTKLANTHFDFRSTKLQNSITDFRNVVLDYLRSKDAFGIKYFTAMKKEEMRDNWDEYTDEIHNKYTWGNCPKLDVSDVPEFRYATPLSIPLDFFLMMLLIGILFIIGVKLFSSTTLIKRD
ncbi:ABC transporter permease [candidate division KSB1 bacterium]